MSARAPAEDVSDLFAEEGVNPADYPDESGPEPASASQETGGTKSNSQATRLVDMAVAGAEFFHTPMGETFAYLEVGDHRETWSLQSRGFRKWLARLYYAKTKGALGNQALQDAINVLNGKATFDGEEREVFTRLAGIGGRLYFDLADPQWRAVEIDSDGWRIVRQPPTRFRRPQGMLALPEPESGGSIAELRPFLNVDDAGFILVGSWLVGALRPRGPYPILAGHGEQGSGKSSLARTLRSIIDPSTPIIRSEPKEVRDLMIAATNGWVLAFDNLSRIQPWFSDALCRLATGGGFATRALYSNDEETLFDSQRPVILNGIEELIARGDLLDRTIVLELQPLTDSARRTEAKMAAEMEGARPRILGGLLDAAAGALRREGTTTIKKLPRMADFAVWVTAAEPSLPWEKGSFMETYSRNCQANATLPLEDSAIGEPLVRFVRNAGLWEGTSADLLGALSAGVGERKPQDWPKTARALSGQLRRLAPALRQVGVGVAFSERRQNRGRRVRLEDLGAAPSQQSPPPPDPKTARRGGDGGDGIPRAAPEVRL